MQQARRIEIGDRDGVNVYAQTPENTSIATSRYVIDLPNDYDVYYQFGRKDEGGKAYAERVPSTDKKRVTFAIDMDKLDSERSVNALYENIRDARTANMLKTKEKADILKLAEEIGFADSFDNGGKKDIILNFGPPSKKVRDSSNQVLQENGKDKTEPGFIGGEVLKTGTYFVLIGDVKNDPARRFLRAVPTANILQKGEFNDRANVIATKFPIGSLRKMSFDEKWKAKDIGAYAPRLAQQPAPEPIQEAIPVKRAESVKVKSREKPKARELERA